MYVNLPWAVGSSVRDMAELIIYNHAPTAAGMSKVAGSSAEIAVGAQTMVRIMTNAGTRTYFRVLGKKGREKLPFEIEPDGGITEMEGALVLAG